MRLISYTIKPGLTDENRNLIAGVFDALREGELADLSYTVLESADGRFLHVAQSTESSSKALQSLPAFRTFVAALEDRQEAPLVISELKIVGTYGSLIGQ
ncbi:MAG: hypothetical protein ABIY37_15680 [Devosia sp.]